MKLTRMLLLPAIIAWTLLSACERRVSTPKVEDEDGGSPLAQEKVEDLQDYKLSLTFHGLVAFVPVEDQAGAGMHKEVWVVLPRVDEPQGGKIPKNAKSAKFPLPAHYPFVKLRAGDVGANPAVAGGHILLALDSNNVLDPDRIKDRKYQEEHKDYLGYDVELTPYVRKEGRLEPSAFKQGRVALAGDFNKTVPYVGSVVSSEHSHICEGCLESVGSEKFKASQRGLVVSRMRLAQGDLVASDITKDPVTGKEMLWSGGYYKPNGGIQKELSYKFNRIAQAVHMHLTYPAGPLKLRLVSYAGKTGDKEFMLNPPKNHGDVDVSILNLPASAIIEAPGELRLEPNAIQHFNLFYMLSRAKNLEGKHYAFPYAPGDAGGDPYCSVVQFRP